jgi:hypothetical protein
MTLEIFKGHKVYRDLRAIPVLRGSREFKVFREFREFRVSKAIRAIPEQLDHKVRQELLHPTENNLSV